MAAWAHMADPSDSWAILQKEKYNHIVATTYYVININPPICRDGNCMRTWSQTTFVLML